MRIVLVGNYEIDCQDSMQRFAALMARGLAQAGHEVRSVRPRCVVGQLHSSANGLGKWLGYVDKFGVFRGELRSAVKWADVVHICDHANAFYTNVVRSSPHVVTCHDLLAIRSAHGEIPQNTTRWTGRQLQRLILNGLGSAQHIVCVSDATRRDLLRIAGIPNHRVSRVYNSLNYPYSRMEGHEAGPKLRKLLADPSRRFFLHVGGNQWYKNRLGVLRIFRVIRDRCANNNFKLIMVGKPWTEEMRRFVKDHGMGEATAELTRVSDEDLRALYSMATMLLFPSLYEGFGWPIIEAQACGCPVLTSRCSPMDEVGGNAAIYIDPHDPESAAVAAARALERLSNMRELGFLNAERFKNAAMIQGYLSIYDKVIGERSGRHSNGSNSLTPVLLHSDRPSICITSSN